MPAAPRQTPTKAGLDNLPLPALTPSLPLPRQAREIQGAGAPKPQTLGQKEGREGFPSSLPALGPAGSGWGWKERNPVQTAGTHKGRVRTSPISPGPKIPQRSEETFPSAKFIKEAPKSTRRGTDPLGT